MGKQARRRLAVAGASYLLLGMAYGMGGEMRLAGKYAGDASVAWNDPHAYVRSIAFAPFWSYDLYWTLKHCGHVFGCSLPAG